MKKRIIISSIVGLVALAAAFFGLQKCESDPTVIYRDQVRTVEVQLPGDTLRMPGRIVVRENIVYPSDSANRALQDSIARLYDELQSAQYALYEYAWLIAQIDTAMAREAVVRLGDRETRVPYTDSLSIAYEYAPVNRFRIERHSSPIIAIDSTQIAEELVVSNGMPWWVNAIVAVGGMVLGVLVNSAGK